jgi:hypothetical protein
VTRNNPQTIGAEFGNERFTPFYEHQLRAMYLEPE